jgi:hypothetical protein
LAAISRLRTLLGANDDTLRRERLLHRGVIEEGCLLGPDRAREDRVFAAIAAERR